MMKRVFVSSADPCDAAGNWSVHFNHAALRNVLGQAATQARQTGKATPACLVLSLPASDPLRIFQAFQALSIGDCFSWEQPSRQLALVGAGAALSLQAQGTERFAHVAQHWRQLREEAVIASSNDSTPDLDGPVLVGGFRFDPLSRRTPLWQDFPDGLLILPRLLFHQSAGQATLTLSCLVYATDNLNDLMNSMSGEVARLSELMRSLPELPDTSSLTTRDYPLRNLRPAQTWKDLVSNAVSSIREGNYAKIVLAREAEVTSDEQDFSLAMTLQQLRQSYAGACVFAFQRGERTFIGATPERLVHARDGQLHTMALAGSAPRGATEEEDRRLGSELLSSQKNRGEHEIVASTIHNALAQLCSRIWIADTPELLRLKNIQHLQTAIVGEFLPDCTLLEALQMLHPTPAVGGSPTEAALAFIREHENLDRGWYAGPFGWIDLHGNGEFAVALRSALLEKRRATLFAGCGIVKDSVPDAEYAESCLKLQVILRSLSGEE